MRTFKFMKQFLMLPRSPPPAVAQLHLVRYSSLSRSVWGNRATGLLRFARYSTYRAMDRHLLRPNGDGIVDYELHTLGSGHADADWR